MAPTETAGVKRTQLISELTKSPHGDLKQYLPIGQKAAKAEPEFLAHLIAWNEKNGQIRDSKVALPVVSLSTDYPKDFRENSLAHMALLSPRDLLRAIRFAKETKTPGNGLSIKRLVESYLRAREANWSWWERTAVQHKASMKSLYALHHIKPNAMADLILMKNMPPQGTVFADIRALSSMSSKEAAGVIMNRKLPFLIAAGALGAKLKEPDLALALLERMTPTEVVTNSKMLEKLGVKTNPALRAAYEAKLQEVAQSKKATFKTTKAAEVLGSAKLQAVQEKQLDALGKVEGNWLVLGDRSPSMKDSIEVSRLVAATLAKLVKGKVYLIFFDGTPSHVLDVTGKTYEQILAETKTIQAGGAGTSIGCGLGLALSREWELDGIAIISDAKENTAPLFAERYQRLVKTYDKEPTVYLYRCKTGMTGWGDHDLSDTMQRAGLELVEYDLTGGIDYYSLPQIISTMRSNRYSLADDIMQAPLLTLEQALKPKWAVEAHV
jgi:hypothetical protein